MLQTNFVEKIKTHISSTINFFPKTVSFMEKYGTARQATEDNIIRRVRIECWITKTTDTYM